MSVLGNEVYVGGVKLDIGSGDVSDFDRTVREHIEDGGGWMTYPQSGHHYQLHITASTDIIVVYKD